MTVKKLIKKLSKLPQDLPVMLGCGSDIEIVKVERYDHISPGIGEAPRDEDNNDMCVLIG